MVWQVMGRHGTATTGSNEGIGCLCMKKRVRMGRSWQASSDGDGALSRKKEEATQLSIVL
jgi:hypothetical protein